MGIPNLPTRTTQRGETSVCTKPPSHVSVASWRLVQHLTVCEKCGKGHMTKTVLRYHWFLHLPTLKSLVICGLRSEMMFHGIRPEASDYRQIKIARTTTLRLESLALCLINQGYRNSTQLWLMRDIQQHLLVHVSARVVADNRRFQLNVCTRLLQDIWKVVPVRVNSRLASNEPDIWTGGTKNCASCCTEAPRPT